MSAASIGNSYLNSVLTKAARTRLRQGDPMTKIIPLPLSTPSSSGFRCEAAKANDHANAHGNVICEAAGDPATLIGLALSFARQGPLFDGAVPPLIRERLSTHASHGNPACRMVLNWLDRHRKVEAAAVIADQRAYRVHDDAATDHHAAWQIQDAVSSLGKVADIGDVADLAEFAEDGEGIPVCRIGSRSSRDLVLSERIVSHAVIEPHPEAKADLKSDTGSSPKYRINPQPRPNSEPHPKGKSEFRLKHKPDPKSGPSLKSGLRSHKHRPIAEIISAKTIKINEEVFHG
jgi:hypothetical protein